jgi:aromatic ring-opening dioxygenase catalytic subunit (LigB family)
MAEYLRRVPSDGRRPRALVVISGHWEEKVVTIQNPAPPLLYDYYGFPESTYQITFPAPGARRLLPGSNLARLQTSSVHMTMPAADHGVFIPLKSPSERRCTGESHC